MNVQTLTYNKSNPSTQYGGRKMVQKKTLEDKAVASMVELGKNLLIASRDGSAIDVRSLLRSGSPFTTDWLGTSPLHYAAQNGHLDCTLLLLSAGISIHSKTKVDKTALHVACQAGHHDVVDALIKCGASIDSQDSMGMTALHWSVERNQAKCVEVLLKYGANVDLESNFLTSPLDLVLNDSSKRDIFELLQAKDEFKDVDAIEALPKPVIPDTQPDSVIDEANRGIPIDGVSSPHKQRTARKASKREPFNDSDLPLPLSVALPYVSQSSSSATPSFSQKRFMDPTSELIDKYMSPNPPSISISKPSKHASQKSLSCVQNTKLNHNLNIDNNPMTSWSSTLHSRLNPPTILHGFQPPKPSPVVVGLSNMSKSSSKISVVKGVLKSSSSTNLNTLSASLHSPVSLAVNSTTVNKITRSISVVPCSLSSTISTTSSIIRPSNISLCRDMSQKVVVAPPLKCTSTATFIDGIPTKMEYIPPSRTTQSTPMVSFNNTPPTPVIRISGNPSKKVKKHDTHAVKIEVDEEGQHDEDGDLLHKLKAAEQMAQEAMCKAQELKVKADLLKRQMAVQNSN